MLTDEDDYWKNRFWPFDGLPPERREIQFLEAAHREGFKPYMFGSENFGANAESRSGVILCRSGRGKHWEVEFWRTDARILSAHVDDFEYAAEAVLRWLRGVTEEAEIIDYFRGHYVITPSTGEGYLVHGLNPRS